MDSCRSLAPISVKLYQLHMAACPSPQVAALRRGTELWALGDLLSSLDWGSLKVENNDLRERALALMCLGAVLSIVKFFVKHFLCQLC